MEFLGRASSTNNDAVFACHRDLPTNSLKILNEEGGCNDIVPHTCVKQTNTWARTIVEPYAVGLELELVLSVERWTDGYLQIWLGIRSSRDLNIVICSLTMQ